MCEAPMITYDVWSVIWGHTRRTTAWSCGAMPEHDTAGDYVALANLAMTRDVRRTFEDSW